MHNSISLLIISYMFRLNCHHQGANNYTAIKIFLQCLCISNVQIIFETYSLSDVIKCDYNVLLIIVSFFSIVRPGASLFSAAHFPETLYL